MQVGPVAQAQPQPFSQASLGAARRTLAASTSILAASALLAWLIKYVYEPHKEGRIAVLVASLAAALPGIFLHLNPQLGDQALLWLSIWSSGARSCLLLLTAHGAVSLPTQHLETIHRRFETIYELLPALQYHFDNQTAVAVHGFHSLAYWLVYRRLGIPLVETCIRTCIMWGSLCGLSKAVEVVLHVMQQLRHQPHAASPSAPSPALSGDGNSTRSITSSGKEGSSPVKTSLEEQPRAEVQSQGSDPVKVASSTCVEPEPGSPLAQARTSGRTLDAVRTNVTPTRAFHTYRSPLSVSNVSVKLATSHLPADLRRGSMTQLFSLTATTCRPGSGDDASEWEPILLSRMSVRSGCIRIVMQLFKRMHQRWLEHRPAAQAQPQPVARSAHDCVVWPGRQLSISAPVAASFASTDDLLQALDVSLSSDSNAEPIRSRGDGAVDAPCLPATHFSTPMVAPQDLDFSNDAGSSPAQQPCQPRPALTPQQARGAMRSRFAGQSPTRNSTILEETGSAERLARVLAAEALQALALDVSKLQHGQMVIVQVDDSLCAASWDAQQHAWTQSSSVKHPAMSQERPDISRLQVTALHTFPGLPCPSETLYQLGVVCSPRGAHAATPQPLPWLPLPTFPISSVPLSMLATPLAELMAGVGSPADGTPAADPDTPLVPRESHSAGHTSHRIAMSMELLINFPVSTDLSKVCLSGWTPLAPGQHEHQAQNSGITGATSDKPVSYLTTSLMIPGSSQANASTYQVLVCRKGRYLPCHIISFEPVPSAQGRGSSVGLDPGPSRTASGSPRNTSTNKMLVRLLVVKASTGDDTNLPPTSNSAHVYLVELWNQGLLMSNQTCVLQAMLPGPSAVPRRSTTSHTSSSRRLASCRASNDPAAPAPLPAEPSPALAPPTPALAAAAAVATTATAAAAVAPSATAAAADDDDDDDEFLLNSLMRLQPASLAATDSLLAGLASSKPAPSAGASTRGKQPHTSKGPSSLDFPGTMRLLSMGLEGEPDQPPRGVVRSNSSLDLSSELSQEHVGELSSWDSDEQVRQAAATTAVREIRPQAALQTSGLALDLDEDFAPTDPVFVRDLGLFLSVMQRDHDLAGLNNIMDLSPIPGSSSTALQAKLQAGGGEGRLQQAEGSSQDGRVARHVLASLGPALLVHALHHEMYDTAMVLMRHMKSPLWKKLRGDLTPPSPPAAPATPAATPAAAAAATDRPTQQDLLFPEERQELLEAAGFCGSAQVEQQVWRFLTRMCPVGMTPFEQPARSSLSTMDRLDDFPMPPHPPAVHDSPLRPAASSTQRSTPAWPSLGPVDIPPPPPAPALPRILDLAGRLSAAVQAAAAAGAQMLPGVPGAPRAATEASWAAAVAAVRVAGTQAGPDDDEADDEQLPARALSQLFPSTAPASGFTLNASLTTASTQADAVWPGVEDSALQMAVARGISNLTNASSSHRAQGQPISPAISHLPTSDLSAVSSSRSAQVQARSPRQQAHSLLQLLLACCYGFNAAELEEGYVAYKTAVFGGWPHKWVLPIGCVAVSLHVLYMYTLRVINHLHWTILFTAVHVLVALGCGLGGVPPTKRASLSPSKAIPTPGTLLGGTSRPSTVHGSDARHPAPLALRIPIQPEFVAVLLAATSVHMCQLLGIAKLLGGVFVSLGALARLSLDLYLLPVGISLVHLVLPTAYPAAAPHVVVASIMGQAAKLHLHCSTRHLPDAAHMVHVVAYLLLESVLRRRFLQWRQLSLPQV